MTINVEGLARQYGPFTLTIPELTVPQGQAFGLVGNNGAGKTTFLRLVLDLIRADRGRVLLDGNDVSKGEAWKAHTGSYLDEGFLIDYLTPDEFLAFTGGVYGLSPEEREASLAPYRSFYTDEPLGKTTKYLRALSQGNRKKAGLIAALFVQPELLILDEPFASLDPRSQIQFKDHLRRLREEKGMTMILSSHDLGHVTEVCDRIALLEGGRIVRDEHTTPDTLRELRTYFAGEAAVADDVETV